MTHERVQGELKALVDGELSGWRRRVVARHVAGCAACREEVTAMEELGRSVNALGREGEAVPEGLRARVLAALPEAPDRVRPRAPLAGYALAVTLVALAAFVVGVSFQLQRRLLVAEAPHVKQLDLGFTQYAQDYDEAAYGTMVSLTARGPVATARKAVAREARRLGGSVLFEESDGVGLRLPAAGAARFLRRLSRYGAGRVPASPTVGDVTYTVVLRAARERPPKAP